MIREIKENNNIIPVLALRDLVMFSRMIVPLFVGREHSIRALDEASKKNNMILMVAQKDPHKESPKPNDLYRVGVVSRILQVLRLQNSNIKILAEGEQKVRITKSSLLMVLVIFIDLAMGLFR